MRQLSSYATCFSLFLMLVACATTPAQLDRVLLDRVLVQNATDSDITDVKVRHEPTNKFGAVNTILSHKALDIGFPEQPMLAIRAVVSWRDGDGREWTETVALPQDHSAAKSGRPMSLIYTIYPSGQITVALQPGAASQ